MPNKAIFVLSIVILISSLISFALAITSQSQLSTYYCIVSIIVGTAALVYWSSISYRWQCTKCQTFKDLSFWGNAVGMNIGLNEKYLYCEVCGERTMYKGVKRDIT